MLAVAGMLAIVVAPTSTAHGTSDHGAITIHDEEGGPDAREVTCEFWVRGTNLTDDQGVIRAAHRLGDRSAHSHDIAEWDGVPDGNGTYSFLVGPLTIHETDDHTFVDTTVGEQSEEKHGTAAHLIEYTACPDESEEDPPAEPQPVECPPVELEAYPRNDGSIGVNASGLHATDFEGELALMRSDGGEFEQVASLEVGNQFYIDTDTEVGTTYTYELVLDGETCSVLEVTAIPVFPTLLAGGAAIGVSMLGYAAMRRRR